MLVDWFNSVFNMLGISNFTGLTLFNLTISTESIFLLIFVVMFVTFTIYLCKCFNKLFCNRR